MLALLRTFSWQELRHHPWRGATAILAVMLGVALAFSVHLINASALDEFAGAVRSVSGQSDLELRAAQGGFDEALFARVASHPQVALASPMLEVQASAMHGSQRTALRVLGIDALVLPSIAPGLMPQPAPGSARLALLMPSKLFLNAAARAALGLQADEGGTLRLQAGAPSLEVEIAGNVAAGGGPLAVMDIGAAQELFGRLGQLTRIDVRLAPGTDRTTFTRSLKQSPDWPAHMQIAEPGDATERANDFSRAYRVNLAVLALVALFTGAFLVFSVLALSVAQRAQQFALLGVLGLSPRERLGLVLAESLGLGLAGSGLGIALGTGLAALGLRLLGGDLGGGYFQGAAPALHWRPGAALGYGALGVLAALVSGWWPARMAQALPEAQTLKGVGLTPADARTRAPWRGALLMACGALLAFAPAIGGVPVAAYLSVGFLLVGGIAALPALIALLYDRLAPHMGQHLLPMLSVERARRMRSTAAVAVSGVVASLSLAIALTVMVASFRDSMMQWLDVVLPADLYLRAAGGGNADAAPFDPGFVQALARLPGVQRVATQRTRPLSLATTRPPVTWTVRGMDADLARSLPLVGPALPVPPGRIGIYVSEAVSELYDVRPGGDFTALATVFPASAQKKEPRFFVAGVWRDYVRQFGAIVIDARDDERLGGGVQVSDIALWIVPGASDADVQQAARALVARRLGDAQRIEFVSVGQIRANSLRIFDRSFAVTYWLQAVAIGIGLFGIAASFSAQVLARRKEFGLLAHLGFTRQQVIAVVAGEGAAWTAIGAIAGLGLGLAVSVILVHVVNPQSFHWTMDMQLPWARLLALCLAVLAAGTLTAWLAGRAATGRDVVLAVKEDW